MRVLVVGATGGSGRAAVAQLLSAGHDVTTFSRRAFAENAAAPRLRHCQGDVMNAPDLERAVQGQEAVVVTLGIRENALSVRFRGPSRTRPDVRSAGTRRIIEAMRKHGVRRLVVQSSYGVGETRHKLGFLDRLFFRLILKPQIADTEKQEELVRTSGLEWVLVQPVHLTDDAEGDMTRVLDGRAGRPPEGVPQQRGALPGRGRAEPPFRGRLGRHFGAGVQGGRGAGPWRPRSPPGALAGPLAPGTTPSWREAGDEGESMKQERVYRPFSVTRVSRTGSVA